MAPYTVTSWQNTPSTATPLSAANLDKLTDELEAQASEKGVFNSLPDWTNGAPPAITDAAPWNEMERVAQVVASSVGLLYTPTVWQAGWTPARNAARLNRLEAQAQANRAAIDTTPSSPYPVPTAIAGQGYSVTFEDHFTSLNIGTQSKWSNGIWYASPRPAPTDPRYSISNSVLRLQSVRDQDPHYIDITTLWHDGVGGRSFKYGYFEARMKWDNVWGSWPAFWLLSTLDRYGQNAASPPTAWCSELDCFEGYIQSGIGPTSFTGTLHKNTGSRWGIADETRGVNPWNDGSIAVVADMTTAFHKYGCLWTATEVSWYFDDVKLKTVQPFESTPQDMFLIMGMQQDSSAGTLGAASTSLYIDYIAVWQK